MVWGPGRRIALLTACVAALGAGCAGTAGEPAAEDPTTPAASAPAETAPAETAPAETPSFETAPAETVPAETAPAQTASEEATMAVQLPLEGLVAQAVEDLAGRIGVDPAEITVVSAESVVWPDASLGCPQPGMRYIQVPEDGALIRLQVDGRVYPYHTGGSRTQPFLCEQPGKPARITPDPRLTPSFDPET